MTVGNELKFGIKVSIKCMILSSFNFLGQTKKWSNF